MMFPNLSHFIILSDNVLKIVVFLLSLYVNNIQAKDLNPINYGLKDCKTGIERYAVIYKCHEEALQKGVGVNYKGIDSVYLVIPPNAKSIPLCVRNNFSNCVFVVRNNERKIPLFSISNPLLDLEENWNSIVKTKKTKDKFNQLIIIEDTIPWVKERRGYGYGHTRKDIVYVKKGTIQNKTIADYDSIQPRLYKSIISNNKILIQNLTFIRDSLSNRITFLFRIENQYNVILNNITSKTPQSDMYEDAIIRLDNCYKVSILNTNIEGTYSQVSKYGYGICLLNVGDVYIKNLKADGNWGVFGNNNVNKIQLIDCDINRFDIHCYGKDIAFRNCTFRKLYNQFSSIYGYIAFENCKFIDFIPILFEPSYNAYTCFNLYIDNCEWVVSSEKNYLISAGNPCDIANPRKELSHKCWPNIYVSKLTMIVPKDVTDIILFKMKYECDVAPELGFINNIQLNDVKAKENETKLNIHIVNKPVKFANPVNITSFNEKRIINDVLIETSNVLTNTNSIIHIQNN